MATQVVNRKGEMVVEERGGDALMLAAAVAGEGEDAQPWDDVVLPDRHAATLPTASPLVTLFTTFFKKDLSDASGMQK